MTSVETTYTLKIKKEETDKDNNNKKKEEKEEDDLLQYEIIQFEEEGNIASFYLFIYCLYFVLMQEQIM